MRKKDGFPIFAKKLGRGFKLMKVTIPVNSEEFNKEQINLEAKGWLLVLDDE